MDDDRIVIVHRKKRLFDGFFKIDEAEITHSKIAGEGFIKGKWLVFERGDSVAALVHDLDRDVIVLTEQFRYPTYEKGPGWLLEPIAGSIEPGETPEQCMRRELLEELGYLATRLDFISRFYVSPGGTSERIFLFYAPVRRADLVNPDASGLEDQNENIKRAEIPTRDFIKAAFDGGYEDAKLLIAAMWLAHKNGVGG